jgi:peptidoglycan/LPS O-acetylase OafA/YrhL
MTTPYTLKEKMAGLPGPGSTETPYFYSLELLRFICAFSIVWGHLGAPYGEFAYAGLDTFILLSVVLSTRSAMRHSLGDFMRRRLRRILIPWLIWCGLYLALRAVAHGPASVFQITDPLLLLIGPEIHLWFLPFLLVTSPIGYYAVHLPHGRRFGAIFTLLAVPICVFAYHLERHFALPEPFLQWSFALPALLYAVCRASGRSLGPILILSGVFLGTFLLDEALPAYFLLFAAAVFEVFVRLPGIGRWAKTLGDAALPIYLVHPFAVVVMARFLDFETQRVALALSVFGVSLIISLTLLGLARVLTARRSPRKTAQNSL